MPEVDPLLGPEMRSTGEVLGIDKSPGLAFYKSQEAAQSTLPLNGTVLISVTSRERPAVLEVAKGFTEIGFNILSTVGTNNFLKENDIDSKQINKLHEGRPNIEDAIKNREIQLVINTPIGKMSQHDDSYIRKAAIKYRVPYITTIAAALAALRGIKDAQKGSGGIMSIQEYHAAII